MCIFRLPSNLLLLIVLTATLLSEPGAYADGVEPRTVIVIVEKAALRSNAKVVGSMAFGDAIEVTQGTADSFRVPDKDASIASADVATPANAIEIVSQRLLSDPTSPDLLKLRAKLHYLLGNPDPAIADATTLIKVLPSSWEAYNIRGEIQLWAAQRFVEAENDFRQALRHNPGNYQLHRKLAYALFAQPIAQPNFTNAASQLTYVIDRQAGTPSDYLNRAACYLMLGKCNDARKDSEVAATIDPSSPYPNYLQSLIHLHRGDFTSAEDQAKRALRIEPTLWLAQEVLTTIEQQRTHGSPERTLYPPARPHYEPPPQMLEPYAHSQLIQAIIGRLARPCLD